MHTTIKNITMITIISEPPGKDKSMFIGGFFMVFQKLVLKGGYNIVQFF